MFAKGLGVRLTHCEVSFIHFITEAITSWGAWRRRSIDHLSGTQVEDQQADQSADQQQDHDDGCGDPSVHGCLLRGYGEGGQHLTGDGAGYDGE